MVAVAVRCRDLLVGRERRPTRVESVARVAHEVNRTCPVAAGVRQRRLSRSRRRSLLLGDSLRARCRASLSRRRHRKAAGSTAASLGARGKLLSVLVDGWGRSLARADDGLGRRPERC